MHIYMSGCCANRKAVSVALGRASNLQIRECVQVLQKSEQPAIHPGSEQTTCRSVVRAHAAGPMRQEAFPESQLGGYVHGRFCGGQPRHGAQERS